MHSVGIIEVADARGSRASEIAAAKGRELGCWAVVEHDIYIAAAKAALNEFGARIILAHGTAIHVTNARPPGAAARFDCVLRGPASRALMVSSK